MNITGKLLKTSFGIYSTIAPSSAAKTGFNMFQKVRKKDLRPREEKLFNAANHYTVNSPVGEIDCYQLGDKNHPPILLVHGWDSNAGSMGNIAFELVKSGYNVYLFNLPGHAFYKNNKTNLLECSLAMTAVIENLDLRTDLSIISHSFGSAVTSFTLSTIDLKVNRVIFLTNPNEIADIFREFKNMLGMSKRSFNKMVDYTESILGTDLERVSVVENLKKANFNALYLIHDKFDKVLPYSNSLSVKSQFPESHLETFEKIGHYKMLWNEEVFQKCKLFLN